MYPVRLHHKNEKTNKTGSSEAVVYATFEDNKYIVFCQPINEQYPDASDRCIALKEDLLLGNLVKSSEFSGNFSSFKASQYSDQNKIWQLISYFFRRYHVDLSNLFSKSPSDEQTIQAGSHETEPVSSAASAGTERTAGPAAAKTETADSEPNRETETAISPDIISNTVALGAGALVLGGGAFAFDYQARKHRQNQEEESEELHRQNQEKESEELLPPEKNSEEFVKGMNAFGLEIFKKLVSKEKSSHKNILYSPLSMNSALSMVGLFSGEQEQKNLLTAMSIKLSFQDFLKESQNFRRNLQESQTEEYQLTVANSFWLSSEYVVSGKNQMVKNLTSVFNASFMNNYAFSNPKTSDAMNNWFSKATDEMIQNLVTAEDVKPLEWAAINAVALDAKWYRKLGASRYSKFTRPDGTVVKAKFMEASAGITKVDTQAYTVWEIPYGKIKKGHPVDKRASFMISHPKNYKQFAKVTQGITADQIAQLRKRIKEIRALRHYSNDNLVIPAFDLDYEVDMEEIKGTLTDMGAGSYFTAFDMTRLHPYFDKGNKNRIKKIKQKAKITVANTGTKAAAASFVGGGAESMGPISTFVDSAFAYVIIDEDSGAVLFAGTFTDPGQAEVPVMEE